MSHIVWAISSDLTIETRGPWTKYPGELRVTSWRHWECTMPHTAWGCSIPSLKKRTKLLLSSLLSSSRALRAPGTSLYHMVPKHLRPRGPGLSNPTSFLRPALPMTLTTDNNARDERSVLRLNPAILLRDFTLYMTTNYGIIRKRCLN